MTEPATSRGGTVSVLVVEDDPTVQGVLRAALTALGWRSEVAGSGEAALPLLERELYDLVMLDVNLPGMSGLSVLSAGVGLQTDAQFVIMSGAGMIADAVDAMRLGAFDYLPKPLNLEELTLVLRRALEERSRRRELAQLRRESDAPGRRLLVGDSPPMRRLHEMILRVAPTRSTVLITGETGTGKELVAREVHRLSDRANHPFVPVHCASFSETLLESELFGHVKGSFTGATSSRRGLVEEAANGTVFLDECSSISASIQAKLLRVLQDHRVQRVGANALIPVDFRLVAASNVDLTDEVAGGRFRDDLYYRLNVFPIAVPPLRDRREDIPKLAAHFLQAVARENGTEAPELTSEALRRLESYDWPGNVRELASVVERAVILHSGSSKLSIDLPRRSSQAPDDIIGSGLRDAWSLDRVEREYIERTLHAVGGNQSQAARILGVDRRTLSRKLTEWAAGEAK
ncbi:MAG: sigma-54-dependent Fis family transcriptional regulator [Gemmatimonadales bacterium]|nr:sigma-54-dependent Fis family transcriptional regulator [Gemmatimonadales bacterium]